jgi:hypothetical protein
MFIFLCVLQRFSPSKKAYLMGPLMSNPSYATNYCSMKPPWHIYPFFTKFFFLNSENFLENFFILQSKCICFKCGISIYIVV